MDMNFIFSWSTRYLTRSLRSLVRYRVDHSKIKFISTRGHVISSMYLSYLKLIRVRSLYHQPIKHLVCYPITIFQLLNIWFIAIQSLFFSHHTSGLLLPDHFFLAIKHLFIVIQSVLFSYQTSSLLLSNQ